MWFSHDAALIIQTDSLDPIDSIIMRFTCMSKSKVKVLLYKESYFAKDHMHCNLFLQFTEDYNS